MGRVQPLHARGDKIRQTPIKTQAGRILRSAPLYCQTLKNGWEFEDSALLVFAFEGGELLFGFGELLTETLVGVKGRHN